MTENGTKFLPISNSGHIMISYRVLSVSSPQTKDSDQYGVSCSSIMMWRKTMII